MKSYSANTRPIRSMTAGASAARAGSITIARDSTASIVRSPPRGSQAADDRPDVAPDPRPGPSLRPGGGGEPVDARGAGAEGASGPAPGARGPLPDAARAPLDRRVEEPADPPPDRAEHRSGRPGSDRGRVPGAERRGAARRAARAPGRRGGRRLRHPPLRRPGASPHLRRARADGAPTDGQCGAGSRRRPPGGPSTPPCSASSGRATGCRSGPSTRRSGVSEGRKRTRPPSEPRRAVCYPRCCEKC